MKRLIFLFILSCTPAFSQIQITEKDIQLNLSHLNNLGQELIIKKNDSTLLAANKYICNYTRRDNRYTIYFEINDAGKPDGVVEVEGKFKTYVANGMRYRYESYYENSRQLSGESFLRGDTIVWKMYNKHNQLRAENWTIKEKTVYAFECECDYETDTIESCMLNDDVNGLYVQYGKGGQISYKKITKNLPKGIIEQFEDYDENGKLLSTEIYYDNEKSKTTYANGEYTLSKPTAEGDYIEKYSKEGKLIEKYTRQYPTSN